MAVCLRLGWARYHHHWPFGPKQIREVSLEEQREHPGQAAMERPRRRPALRRLADRRSARPGLPLVTGSRGVKATPFGTQDEHDPERVSVLCLPADTISQIPPNAATAPIRSVDESCPVSF